MVQGWPGKLHTKREGYVCVELLRNSGTEWTHTDTDGNREYARRKKWWQVTQVDVGSEPLWLQPYLMDCLYCLGLIKISPVKKSYKETNSRAWAVTKGQTTLRRAEKELLALQKKLWNLHVSGIPEEGRRCNPALNSRGTMWSSQLQLFSLSSLPSLRSRLCLFPGFSRFPVLSTRQKVISFCPSKPKHIARNYDNWFLPVSSYVIFLVGGFFHLCSIFLLSKCETGLLHEVCV